MNPRNVLSIVLSVCSISGIWAQNIIIQTQPKPAASTKPATAAPAKVSKWKKPTKWTAPKQPIKGQPAKASTAKYGTSYPAWSPSKPEPRNVVYQYIDTTFPNSQNHFPLNGNVGIGTNAPQTLLELKKGVGNVRTKNILLSLSNEWAEYGQNEPSMMFSNGDLTNPSYWTVGARVSGDKSINTPQTFKVCFKAPTNNVEEEYFSIDSYQGRVKIGNVNTMVDGYKLYVEQGILTEKVKVAVKDSQDWFDHVLKKDYKLIPLTQLEKYIADNGHLPDVPTTEEVMKQGVDLGQMNGILLKKVEELTLYIIDLKKQIDETQKKLEALTPTH